MNISTAVLWDIENVTPSSDSLFTEGLLNLIEENGNLASATAFGDWTRRTIQRLARQLAEKGFELIHVPFPKSKKNSADVSLITYATQMVFQYPHIERFIIVTGDIDFRPLLFTLRKHGKQIWIVCDSKNASEDLLTISDKYFDYRNLIPDDDLEEDEEDQNVISRDEAFNLLVEAIDIMERDNKKPTLGSVKVKMKLLNASFNEERLGYKKWKYFIQDAARHHYIGLNETDNMIVLTKAGAAKEKSEKEESPGIFIQLIEAIKELDGKNDWVDFSQVSNKLKEKKADIRRHGYNKLKKLILDAEKRGLVETWNKELKWHVRLK